jgi:orotidine-5'-phosphate decarboxylase
MKVVMKRKEAKKKVREKAREKAREKIIVALDVDSLRKAKSLVRKLAPHVKYFKVGLELISAGLAPKIIKFIHSLGGQVFYDGKFDDIPNTVGNSTKQVVKLDVKMLNIHASAGIEAMMTAVANKKETIVLAVTVLTSLDDNNAYLVFGGPSQAKVLQFARDAKISGCDGIVCSPQELKFLAKKKELGDLLKITPGVRPEWANTDDQKRVMTPAEAIEAGATFLVIGRPITNPPKEVGTPVDAVNRIIDEILTVL